MFGWLLNGFRLLLTPFDRFCTFLEPKTGQNGPILGWKGSKMGQKWVIFGWFWTIFGSIRGHVKVACGSFWHRFGILLGSFWCCFDPILRPFVPFLGYFWTILDHFRTFFTAISRFFWWCFAKLTAKLSKMTQAKAKICKFLPKFTKHMQNCAKTSPFRL